MAVSELRFQNRISPSIPPEMKFTSDSEIEGTEGSQETPFGMDS